MGLLDLNDPEGTANLGLIMGLLSAKQGDNWGGLLMQAANQQQQRKAQMGAQQLQSMQIDEMRRKLMQDNTDRTSLTGAPDFGAPTAPNMAPTPENAAQLKTPSQFDQASKMVEYLRKKGVSQSAIKPYLDMMEKFRPKAKADQVTVMIDGKPVIGNVMDDGSFQPIQGAPMPKYKEANLGGSVGFFDETSGKMGPQFGKSLSPDTQYTGGVTMRGQDIVDRRARDTNAIMREGQQSQVVETPSGPIVVNKGTAQSRPVTSPSGAPVPGDAQMKRENGAKNVLELLDQAEGHLKGATNSYAGAGVDIAARAVGHAMPGAQEIAALKTIEGALLMQMPRMEGPQSNYDVQNYKEAAGQLGNPTIPRESKQTAINTIRTIQQKYAGGTAVNAAKRTIRKYNAATGKIE